MADDYIGWNTQQVAYSRSHHGGSPVCGARIPQAMFILTNGTSQNEQNYLQDFVGEDIYTDHVTAYRNGVSQTTNQ